MTQHVVIRREEYVAGTAERPKVMVFTQTHASRPPVPWGKIRVGDVVWMKWSGGPIIAKGIVEGFRQITNCTPALLRKSVAGTALFHLRDYWRTRPPVLFLACRSTRGTKSGWRT